MAITHTEMIDSFLSTVLSSDGVWGDYDIYTNKGVPKGATVEIVLCNLQTGVENTMGVRPDGSSLARYLSIHEAEAGGESTAMMLVTVDSTTGLIEAYHSDVSDADVFRIIGYFTGVVFTDTFNSTAVGGGSWTDLDLGTNNSRVHLIVVQNTTQDSYWVSGIRTNGSSLERTTIFHEPEAGGGSFATFYVKSDSSDIIEHNSSANDIIDLGYFDSTVDFVEKWDSLGAGGTGWLDTDLTVYLDQNVRLCSVLCFNTAATDEYYVGIRANGSAIDRYILEHEHEEKDALLTVGPILMTTLTDADGVLEAYQTTANSRYILTGYFKSVSGGLTQSITETTFAITDTRTSVWSAKSSLLEVLTVTEYLIKIGTLYKLIEDTMNLLHESLSVDVDYYLWINETSDFLDSVIGDLSGILTQVMLEALTATDYISYISSFKKLLENSMAYVSTGELLRTWTAKNSLVNTMDVTEITSKKSSKVVSQDSTILDYRTSIWTAKKVLLEQFTKIDYFTKIWNIKKVLSELTFNITDYVGKLLQFSQRLENPIDLSDSFSKISSFKSSLFNTMNLADTAAKYVRRLVENTMEYLSTGEFRRVWTSKSSLFNTMNVTESASKKSSKVVSQDSNIADYRTSIWSAKKVLSELTFNATDYLTRIWTAKNSLFNTANIAESISRFAISKVVSQDSTLNDYRTSVWTAKKLIENTMDISNTAMSFKNYITRLQDMTLSYYLTTVRSFKKLLEETTTILSDSIATALAGITYQVITNTFDMTDYYTRVWTSKYSLLDTSAMIDYFSRISSFKTTLTETAFNITDSLSKRITTLVTSTAAFLDNVSRRWTSKLLLSQGSTLADSISNKTTWFYSLLNSFNYVDLLTRNWGAKTSITNTANISDTINRIWNSKNALLESITLSGTFSTITGFIRSFIENITLQDFNSIFNAVVSYVSMLEGFILTDSIGYISSFKRVLTENNILADSILSIHTALRTILQGFSLSDSISKYTRITREEVLYIVEYFDKSIGFVRSILDMFNILDFILPGGQRLVLIDEIIAMADILSPVGHYTRQSSNDLTISDELSTLYQAVYFLLLSEVLTLGALFSGITAYVREILESSTIVDTVLRGIKLDIRITSVEMQLNGIRGVLVEDYKRMIRVLRRRRKVN